MNKFIPVELVSYADRLCHVQVKTVSGIKDLVVEECYSFPKQKVIIPKFVAEWIEENKKSTKDLKWVFNAIPDDRKVYEWMKENSMLFFRAWLDGYEVEQEKLYTVEIPNPNKPDKNKNVLSKNSAGKVFLDVYLEDDDLWKNESICQLTEAEIKEDFEWAFRWAEEVKE